MYLDEQLKLYNMAYMLVTEQHFELLHIDENADEIWLEKYENKTSKLVRLAQKGFDWKNHLKRDVAQVFQKTKAMKKLLRGKKIEVYNVYISSHAPVDDWEALKKPMLLNEKKMPLKMKVYYIEKEGSINEIGRFANDLSPQLELSFEESGEEEKEEKVSFYKSYLINALASKKKAFQDVFTFGKPLFTYILIAINIFIFLLLELNGGSSSIDTLIEMGAKYNPYILDGEWWRMVTSMFLHIGLLHLVMNMLAIYYLGTIVERIYGNMRFLFIYFLAGIGGGLASFAFSPSVSAGASGAIFGLFGALLFFGLIYKRIFLQTMGQSVIIILLINLVFGFSIQQIDMGAHIGGLLAGFIASGILYLPKKRNVKIQLLTIFAYILLISALIIYGSSNNISSQSYQLMEIEELLSERNYEEVIEVASHALELKGDMEAAILFQRSYAYIQLNEIDLAIEDLEQSIEFESALPEAYYNLALLYYDKEQLEDAREMIGIAYEMKPDEEAFKEMYEKITTEIEN